MFLFAATMLMAACEKEEPNNDNTLQLPKVEKIPNAVTDIDGNVYDAIKIGSQVWMASNLRTTHFANGDTIPVGENMDGEMPYRYAPDGNEDNVSVYGYLYNGVAAMHSAGLCPDGWHLPSVAEWNRLADTLGGAVVAGGKLKATGTEFWTAPNTAADNASGFTALPAGYFKNGQFGGRSTDGCFWTSSADGASNASYRQLLSASGNLFDFSYSRSNAHSVRCVK